MSSIDFYKTWPADVFDACSQFDPHKMSTEDLIERVVKLEKLVSELQRERTECLNHDNPLAQPFYRGRYT